MTQEQKVELVSEGLMTIGEVQEFLNCGRTFVNGLFAAGELTRVKLGTKVGVPRKQVVEYAARHLEAA